MDEPKAHEPQKQGQPQPSHGQAEDEASRTTGRCSCSELPTVKEGQPNPTDLANLPIRRVLKQLDEMLDTYEIPTDATKKLADDLKEVDKEYQGFGDVAAKYQKFHAEKLDCLLAEANSHKEEIDGWYKDKVTQGDQRKIHDEIWQQEYEDKEKDLCCEWVKAADRIYSIRDCLTQSHRNETEAKEYYENVKGLEKTATDRFSDLKSLYDKAKGYRDAERYKSVFAVSIEYDKALKHVAWLDNPICRRLGCPKDAAAPPKDSTVAPGKESKPEYDGEELKCDEDLKTKWLPVDFKSELTRSLRALILAKYKRFLWHQDSLKKEEANKKAKEACEKIRKSRRDEFYQEAEDVQVPANGAPAPSQTKPPQTSPQQSQQPPPQQSPPPYQEPKGGVAHA